MPGGNRMGPMSAGSMTGRAAGFCAGYATPGFANHAGGRKLGLGMGRGCGFVAGGRGGGFGFRNRNYAAGAPNVPVGGSWQAPEMTADQEKEYLSNDVKALENELKATKKRLSELTDK